MGLVEFETGSDRHAVGLAEFNADDELGTGRPGMAHHRPANAVVAADADDVTRIEAMASAKGDPVFGRVEHFHPGVMGPTTLVSPSNRQLAGRGFTGFGAPLE